MHEVKKELTKKPDREDVHEQREPEQKRECLVQKPRPPVVEEELDQQRADWEGMARAPSTPPLPRR
jgi:hypothetical protein